MRTLATLVISVLGMLTTPVAAADFFCPKVDPLPSSLNLAPVKGQGITLQQQQRLQAFLDNLKSINGAYRNARTNGQRNQLANCLLGHLVSLPDNNTLQSPKTRTDGATWFLIRAEAVASLNMLQPRDLRHKMEIRFINNWLTRLPDYRPTTLAFF